MFKQYHLQNIRTLLTEGFSAEELRIFCFDTPDFTQVHHELAELTGKKAIVQCLLDFAQRQERLDSLLAWVERYNPAKYALHRPYFDGDDAPTTAELAEIRARYLELMINRHQDLDFVGIPELKDRQALHLEEVFINLQAEVEAESRLGTFEIKPGEIWAEAIEKAAAEARKYPPETIKRRLSAHEALAEYPCMVILGDPGAGKTTLLKHIILAFAQNQPDRLDLSDESRLPIFVRLYDYVAKRAIHPGDYSLLDYFYTQAHENLLLDLPPRFFEAELDRGQCCVCLDGLDELGAAGLRREVSAAVASLAHRYPGNRYLITSRLVGYHEAPLERRDFVHHTVLPFSEDDIRRFVVKWYEAREKDPIQAKKQAEHLTETIMKQPPLKSLAANPLMLTIIALVHRLEAELPHERVKLYDKCVTALIETWEQVKRLSEAERERPYYQRRRHLLERLAFWLHTQPAEGAQMGRTREMAEGDLRLQITRFLLDDPQLKLDKRRAAQEAEDFITMVKARTGLLVERGEGVYSFAHLTFQEYLAAAYLEYEHADSIDDLWAIIQPHLHNPAWREVILLLLGSLNKFRKHPTALVRRIFESTDEYEDILHRHLFLAARALADRVRVDTALHDEIVDKLLALTRSQELARNDALNALATLQGDERATAGLLVLAQNSQVDNWLRRSAAQALGELGQPEKALSILLGLALGTQVWFPERLAAAKALGELGQTEKAASILLGLAQDTQVWFPERLAAAKALGELGQTEKAASILLGLAQGIQWGSIRWLAAQALGELGRADESILCGLLDLAQDTQGDDSVRHYAAKSLGQLGRADESILSGLLDLAQDTQRKLSLRHVAAKSLGQLGWVEEAASVLWELAQEADIGYYAVKSLGQLGRADESILSGLLDLAHDTQGDLSLRSAAARSLGKLGWVEEAASVLWGLAQDTQVQNEARYRAAESLGQLGWVEEAASVLWGLAQDTQVVLPLRRAAAESLGQLGWIEQAALVLLELIQDSQVDPPDRSAAYNSLKALLGGEALKP